MNETQFARHIRQQLGQATRLDPSVAERLRAAREQALARHRPDAAGERVVGGHALGAARTLGLRVVLPLVVLAVALATTYAWQQQQRAAEIEELDAQLLASDLPIDAYLDQGFAAWLKRRASQ